jgi:hypothetical protein
MTRFLGGDVILDIEALDFTGEVRGEGVASNLVTVAMPDLPSLMALHVSATLLPTGEMHPRPVMTTRRFLERLKRFS